MHQYKPTQIDKSRSVLVALKWVEHAIRFIYEAVCNNVFAEENCFFYETENDLLGRGGGEVALFICSGPLRKFESRRP